MDHSAQSGSSVTTSRRTFVSTSVTSTLAARHCHDGVGSKSFARVAPQLRKAARLLLRINLDKNHAAIWCSLEIDPVAWIDVEQVAYSLGDRDLSFARDLCSHVTHQ